MLSDKVLTFSSDVGCGKGPTCGDCEERRPRVSYKWNLHLFSLSSSLLHIFKVWQTRLVNIVMPVIECKNKTIRSHTILAILAYP